MLWDDPVTSLSLNTVRCGRSRLCPAVSEVDSCSVWCLHGLLDHDNMCM